MEKKLKMTPHSAASRKFPHQMLNAVLNKETGELMEYRHFIGKLKYREIWGRSYGNKLDRLAQGTKGRVVGGRRLPALGLEGAPRPGWASESEEAVEVAYDSPTDGTPIKQRWDAADARWPTESISHQRRSFRRP